MDDSPSKPSILRVMETYNLDVSRLHPDRRRNPNIKCVSPEHEDRSPSCSIDTENQRYHCWSCEAHGDSIDLIALLEGCDLAEAFSIARRDYGLEGSAVSRKPAQPARWRPAGWDDD